MTPYETEITEGLSLTQLKKLLKGDQGIQGFEGHSPLHVQETKPTGIDVQEGDIWHKPSTEQWYGKTSDGWKEILKRGIQGLEGVRGKDGKSIKGEKGDKGADGKDAILDTSSVEPIAKRLIKDHETTKNHDPFLIGSKKLSEAGLQDGQVITYDAKDDRLIYTTIKQVAQKVSQLGGRGLSLPSQAGNSGKFLTTDGNRSSWATVSGSGDVVGPASAVNNNFAAFDLTTGKLIKDAGVSASSFATALGADDNYVTDAEKTKLSNLSGTNTGDQNLFRTIAVSGQSDVVADSTTDTLTLVEGANITITTDATTDTITIAAASASGITRSVNSVSTNTTAGAAGSTDYVYICTSTFTLTMPTAVGNSNRYSVKNAGVGTITVAFNGVQTADGSATLSLLPNVSVDLISDGTDEWYII